ncbi:MAG: DUF3943 domain-containing protein [Deltaproteobacteria bacterium]|nr:DUF3943 domain-containing protein [Deltaproteobacteria bacterium]
MRIDFPPIRVFAVVMVTAICLLTPLPGKCTNHVGPPKPSCETLPQAALILMPIARTVILNAGMYAGLVILWPHAFAPKQGTTDSFRESFSTPPYMNSKQVFFQLDDDPWFINTILHGIYGSEVYLSARTYGHNAMIGFLYAAFASTTWEYLVESWFHRPSGIDLIWTPFAGAVIGELRFQLMRLILRRVPSRGVRIALVSLLDPLGQLERLMLGCRLGDENGCQMAR